MDACPICGKRVKLDQSRVCHKRFDFRPAHSTCYYAQRFDERDISHNKTDMEEIKLEGEPETPVDPAPAEPAPADTPAEPTPAEPAPDDVPAEPGEATPAADPGADGIDENPGV